MNFPNLSAWAIHHQSLVRYLIVVLMASGIFSYFKLGQMEDPEFTMKVMFVQTFWFGANAQEMEEQVTERIEKKLQELPFLDNLRSYSRPNESVVFIELKGSTPPKEVPNLWYQVRKKIDDIRYTLPNGVSGPYANDEFGDTYGSILAFTADGFNYAELREYVKEARKNLLRVKDVSKVEMMGLQDERIYIELSNNKLATLQMNPSKIVESLQQQNAVVPAGAVNTQTDKVFLRVTGDFDSVETVRNIGIEINGNRFRLGDIANVFKSYVDPPTYKVRFQGQEAIALAISMRKGGNVIELGKYLDIAVSDIKKNLPVGIDIHEISNQPAVVGASVKEFLKVLLEAVVIVLIVSFISLGLRTGLVVALSIPLVLAMTFSLMMFFGIDLQRISLGALIIALGLLVDDAMIAVEMMALKMEQGWKRFDAATYAFNTTAFPMLTGTLITAAGFLPIATAKSNAGEYTFSIFAVVTMALLMSWIVAVIFTPYLGYKLLPTYHIHEENHVDVYQRPFYKLFRAMVTWCVRHRWIVIFLTILTFATAIYCFQFVQQQFFPASNRPELFVDMTLPEGSSFEATQAEVLKLEELLKKDENVANFVSYVGGGSPRFYLSLNVKLQNTNFAQVVIMTKGIEAREAVLLKLKQLFAEDFPNVRGRVSRLENGPPVGFPIQYRVLGDDIEKVRDIALQLATLMRQNPHTYDVHLDWAEKAKKVKVEIDQDKARSLGISSEALSFALNNYLNGNTVTQFRENDELIPVVIRAIKEERGSLSRLDNLNIHLSDGRFVPLSQIARTSLEFEEGIIWRRDRLRNVTVQADIMDGAQAPTLSMQLEPVVNELRKTLPPNYRIDTGGAIEKSAESQQSIAVGMPMMLVIAITLLMIQLQSMQRTTLVLLTAPLGLIGMVLFLILLDRPFGFVAMLGVISLAGMIMRNSVILVDQIEQDRAQGVDTWTAIIESTVRRFRPIMLTALAAILAMIPLSHSIFWGPMAVAIMGGLLVATLFTLFFLPALYAAWFRVKPVN